MSARKFRTELVHSLHLHISALDGKQPYDFKAHTVHCVEADGREWHVGVVREKAFARLRHGAWPPARIEAWDEVRWVYEIGCGLTAGEFATRDAAIDALYTHVLETRRNDPRPEAERALENARDRLAQASRQRVDAWMTPFDERRGVVVDPADLRKVLSALPAETVALS